MTQWDDFDCTLATALDELPPSEETVRDVTPWRTAMGRIVWGLCLTSFTAGFAYLQYILPAIGTVQLYLGFRTLRNGNRWFRFAWYVSICRAVLLYAFDMLAATPWSSRPWPFLTIATALALFLSLHMGLVQAAKDVDQPVTRRPALWAAVWYTVLFAISLTVPELGIVAFLPFLLAFIIVLNSLCKARDELEGCGYAVHASPVKLGGGWFAGLYLGSLLLAILLAAGASNHIAMPSYEQVFDSSETASINAHLQDLGFPADLLERLPEEELHRLEGAYFCSVHRNGDRADAGSKKGIEAIRFDTVYVQTSPNTVRVYEFFNFQKDTLRSNFKAMTMLDPARSAQISDITGGLTWTMDGTAYRSQLPISRQTYESMFFGSNILPSAIFSYPFFSQERAGYMAYTSYEAENRNTTASVLRAYLTTYRSFYPYGALTTDTFQTDWYAQSYSTFNFVPQP